MGRVLWVILALVVLIVLIVGGGVWYTISNLDEIVKKVIETEGSKAAGVAVRVEDVELTLAEGRATLHGLRIANPPGFSDAPIFDLGEISVAIDPESARERTPLVIDEVTIRSPHVRYEVDSEGASNIDVLEKRIGKGGGETGAEEPAQEPTTKPLKMRVRHFVFEKGQITADLRAIGEKERSLELPAIRLDELGGRDGATADEIGQEAIGVLTDRVVRAVARAGIEGVLDKALNDTSGDTKKAVKGLLDRLGR